MGPVLPVLLFGVFLMRYGWFLFLRGNVFSRVNGVRGCTIHLSRIRNRSNGSSFLKSLLFVPRVANNPK